MDITQLLDDLEDHYTECLMYIDEYYINKWNMRQGLAKIDELRKLVCSSS